MKNKNYIYLYDKNLVHYLLDNDEQLRYVTTGLHVRSKNRFWCFEKTEDIQSKIKAYRLVNSPNKADQELLNKINHIITLMEGDAE